jgi:hypothetical protein
MGNPDQQGAYLKLAKAGHVKSQKAQQNNIFGNYPILENYLIWNLSFIGAELCFEFVTGKKIYNARLSSIKQYFLISFCT